MKKWLAAHWYGITATALFIAVIIAVVLLAIPHRPDEAKRPATPTPARAIAHATATQPKATPVTPKDTAAAPKDTPAVPKHTASAPAALSLAVTPGPASKNHEAEPRPAPAGLGNPATGVALAGGALVACGANANLDWSTTTNSFQVVCACTLTLPEDGWALITADGSVSGLNCEYEARFRLGIDDTAGDPATDRWVNVYCDTADGMDAVVAVSALKPLKAGTHTFYLLGRRSAGTGTVLVHDASLAVVAWAAAAQ